MSLCLCRFILHLRELDLSAGAPGTPKSTSSGLSRFADIAFMSRLLGNIGASLKGESNELCHVYNDNYKSSPAPLREADESWAGVPLHEYPLLAGLVAETGLNTLVIDDRYGISRDGVSRPNNFYGC